MPAEFRDQPQKPRRGEKFRIAGTDFPLTTQRIAVGGIEVPLACVPYSPEQLERIAALRGLRERDWPYWLEDWPATYALAEALAAEDPQSLGTPVLDLGCGSGFMAAFLRLRFGLHAFSFDFNADACRLAALNGMEGSRVFCADFGHFPSRISFGLVLCGEMLYARENHAPILEFLGRHLAPDGTAWLADPGRSAAEGFSGAAEKAGFAVSLRQAVSPPSPGDKRATGRNTHVYRLHRTS